MCSSIVMIKPPWEFNTDRMPERGSRSLFTKNFVNINQPLGFLAWEYSPGMGFMDNVKWWGARDNRAVSHEGLDLCCFRDTKGRLHEVDPNLQFPPLFSGSVVGVFADFIGKSVLFRHDFYANNGWRLYSIFGHTLFGNEIVPGNVVGSTQAVVSLAEPQKSSSLAAHLHISLMWISPGHESEALDWGSLGASDDILLIDPLEVL